MTGTSLPDDDEAGATGDAPARTGGRAPERRCIVTRESAPAGGLIRFVRAPDGSVVADLAHKLPGRGAWVTASRTAVETAVRKGLFGRALKAEVRAAPDLADTVEADMRRRALGALGLARKAGELIAGYAQVGNAVERVAIGRGELAAFVLASDAAPDALRRMGQFVGRLAATGRQVPLIRIFSSADLGLALGRPNVIHAAVLAGRAGDGFLSRAHAIAGYGGAAPDVSGTAGIPSEMDERDDEAARSPQS